MLTLITLASAHSAALPHAHAEDPSVLLFGLLMLTIVWAGVSWRVTRTAS